jgi:hypothetical protein
MEPLRCGTGHAHNSTNEISHSSFACKAQEKFQIIFLLAAFAFRIIERTSNAQRLVQIVVNRLNMNKRCAFVAYNPLNAAVRQRSMVLLCDGANTDKWSASRINEAQSVFASRVISKPAAAERTVALKPNLVQ